MFVDQAKNMSSRVADDGQGIESDGVYEQLDILINSIEAEENELKVNINVYSCVLFLKINAVQSCKLDLTV